MIQQISLRLKPVEAASELTLVSIISTRLGIDANRIKAARVVRRSIDARQRMVMVNVTVDAYIDEMPEAL